MRAPYFVTLDFGSTSAKCLIFDAEGKKAAQVKRKWQFSPRPNASDEQTSFDGRSAWNLLSVCCREALSSSRVPLNEIACVIPTSQRHGAVLLEKDGEFLFSFTNADGQSAPPWENITAQHGEAIYQETGRWPQKVFLPAHLFWLKAHHPHIYKRVMNILGIQDWMVYQLSGEIVSERTIAGDLLLMNVKTGKWSQSVADLFQVELSALPTIQEAGTQVGRVSMSAAEDTGLLSGTPVLNGAADSQIALLGAGALSPRDTVIIFGTSIPVLYLMDKPCFHPEGATWTNSHALPSRWVLESNSGDAGLCLNLFHSELLPNLSALIPPPSVENLPTLFELDSLAGNLDHKRTNLIASWGPVIFHGKYWPEVNGTIKGLKLLDNHPVGWADLFLSLIENSGLAILGNLLQLVETAGKEASKVYLGGPAVDSAIWQRMLAGILGTPVLVPDEKEITPLGAAVLAASKAGVYADLPSAVRGMVHTTEITPQEDLVRFYQDRYQDWLEVYRFSLS